MCFRDPHFLFSLGLENITCHFIQLKRWVETNAAEGQCSGGVMLCDFVLSHDYAGRPSSATRVPAWQRYSIVRRSLKSAPHSHAGGRPGLSSRDSFRPPSAAPHLPPNTDPRNWPSLFWGASFPEGKYTERRSRS